MRKKRIRIEFLLSQQEKEIIEKYADKLGLNTGDFVHKAVDRYIWELEVKEKNGD